MQLFLMLVVIFENYIFLSVPEIFYERHEVFGKWIALVLLVSTSLLFSTAINPFACLIHIFIVIMYSAISLKKGSIFSKVMLSFFSLSLILVTNFVVFSIVNFFGNSSEQIFDKTSNFYVIEVLTSKLLLLMVFLLFKSRRIYVKLKTSEWLLFAIAAISTMGSGFIILILFMDSQKHSILYTFAFLFLIIIFIAFYFNFFITAKHYNESLNKSLELKMLEANRELSEKVVESYKSYRKLQHDLKYHFLVLYSKAEESKCMSIIDYLDSVVCNIKGVEVINTKNHILNNLINSQILIMEEKNIDFAHQISDDLCDIRDCDLAIIIGNILGNAIEAQTVVERNRKIFMKIVRNHNILCIEVKNTYKADTLCKCKGKYITTKSSKELHGYGLANVKCALDKYDGDIKIDTNEKVFSVKIMLFTT